MTLEEGMVAYLNTVGSLSAVQNKISPLPLPQLPVLPWVTYSRIDTNHVSSHSGSSSLDYSRIQLDVWTVDYATAHTLGEALTTALDMKKGTWGTVTVYLSDVLNEMDMYDPVTGYYRFIVDVRLWWLST